MSTVEQTETLAVAARKAEARLAAASFGTRGGGTWSA